MENKYITIVDIGSYMTRACTVSVLGNDVKTIAYRQQYSDGVSDGRIHNIKKCSEIISSLISRINGDLGIRISKVVTGIPMSILGTDVCTVRKDRPDPDLMIEETEMQEMTEMLIKENTPEKEQIIQAIPIAFRIGDYNESSYEDTIGMTGEFIEGTYRIFSASESSLGNIVKTFKMAGLEIAAMYPLTMAVPEAVLYDHEKSSGVAVIEVGAETTNLAIYEGDTLRYINSTTFGGKNITGDIAMECHITKDLAESIKRDYGYATPERISNLSEKSLQIRMRDGRHIEIPIKYLSEIIESRCIEIFDAMLYYIEESGYADIIPSGIVLTGGSANLTCIADLLRNKSGYPVRIATPLCHNVRNSISKIDDAASSSVMGLLGLAVKDEAGLDDATVPEEKHPAYEEPVQNEIWPDSSKTAENGGGNTGTDHHVEKTQEGKKKGSIKSFLDKIIGSSNDGNSGDIIGTILGSNEENQDKI